MTVMLDKQHHFSSLLMFTNISHHKFLMVSSQNKPMNITYVPLKDFPESFVLNPLDFDNVKASHGFIEKSFDLLKFI